MWHLEELLGKSLFRLPRGRWRRRRWQKRGGRKSLAEQVLCELAPGTDGSGVTSLPFPLAPSPKGKGFRATAERLCFGQDEAPPVTLIPRDGSSAGPWEGPKRQGSPALPIAFDTA